MDRGVRGARRERPRVRLCRHAALEGCLALGDRQSNRIELVGVGINFSFSPHLEPVVARILKFVATYRAQPRTVCLIASPPSRRNLKFIPTPPSRRRTIAPRFSSVLP